MVKSYCVKQRKQTECVEPSGYKKAKNGRFMFFCTCAECGIKKINLLRIRETNSACIRGRHFRYRNIHWSRFIFNKRFTLAW